MPKIYFSNIHRNMEYILHIYYNTNNGNNSIKAFQLIAVICTHRTLLCQMDSSNLKNKIIHYIIRTRLSSTSAIIFCFLSYDVK